MLKALTKRDITSLLSSRFSGDFHTKLSLMPPPMSFKDMEKAVLRVKEAKQKQESIFIVGDYDADGVIASLIMSEFFSLAKISHKVYLPNRFSDGYGLNPNIVQKLDCDLIITTDNGITAFEAADECKKIGKTLIITDHHSCSNELPNAYAIVNPKQNDCKFVCSEICGAQVAWYFCAALKEVCELDIDLSRYLELLCIAIIADMMELKDLNRLLVKKGLEKLNRSTRPAFKAIKDFFNKDNFKSDDISFLIAPLINSAGRMDDAMKSFDFLHSQTYNEAMTNLEALNELNNKRKKQESDLFESSLEFVDEDKKAIVVWGKEWHEGVIGIVASRLSRRFKKPSFVFSLKEDYAKGSARSVGEIDILSLICKSEEFVVGYGGHKGAAGICIEKEKLEDFKNSLEKNAENLQESDFKSQREILGIIDSKEIDGELLRIIQDYEPYGEKNPRPNFILKNVFVEGVRLIGKDQNHLKMTLKSQDCILDAIFFNFNKKAKRGDEIDIVFSVSENNYQGQSLPQLIIKEII